MNIKIPLLTIYSHRTISLFNGTVKEGTVSTASRNCRFHQQRLQGRGNNAPRSSESFGAGPWALRPKRLQWLANIIAEFKIAALCDCGSKPSFFKSIFIRQGAMSRHSPPITFQNSRAPPRQLSFSYLVAGITGAACRTAASRLKHLHAKPKLA